MVLEGVLKQSLVVDEQLPSVPVQKVKVVAVEAKPQGVQRDDVARHDMLLSIHTDRDQLHGLRIPHGFGKLHVLTVLRVLK